VEIMVGAEEKSFVKVWDGHDGLIEVWRWLSGGGDDGFDHEFKNIDGTGKIPSPNNPAPL
jgi:hypothetical protein